jgi:hypothetical protein
MRWGEVIIVTVLISAGFRVDSPDQNRNAQLTGLW